MTLHPTPNGVNCPICGDEDCLVYAEDFTKYYRVTALSSKKHGYGHLTYIGSKSYVEGEYDTSEGDADCRLFCYSCGEYFELPEKEDFTGG